jgi:large subunit ribosomal protein L29
MEGAEVRKMRDEEIKLELEKLKSRAFDLRAQSVTEKVEDTSQFRKVRKDIARLLTERRSRQMAKAAKK